MKTTTYINDYDFVKNAIKNNDVRAIFNVINYDCISKTSIEYSDRAYVVFDVVEKYGEGFVVDICQRVKTQNIRLSDKQRWCLVFAIIKIGVDKVEELQKEERAELEVE